MAQAPRPNYLDEFKPWLNDRHDTLGVELVPDTETDEVLTYWFKGYKGQILLVVKEGEIAVAAMKDGEVWDFFYCIDSVVESSQEEQFVCVLCEEPRKVYGSIQEAWEEHDFDLNK